MRMAFLLALLACKADSPTDSDDPIPGELRVGIGHARIPAPLGIGTAGYGGFFSGGEKSPFSELYPATQQVHNHPNLKAVAISRGDTFEVIFLRIDSVGMFQQLRASVLEELQGRTGRDLSDALIIGATHTHSGPGRMVNGGGPYELITDKFFPEYYENMVTAMADTVEQALTDLKPGRIGTGYASAPDGHQDRRCEDGETYKRSDIPILAIEQEGTLVGLHIAYAIHGTILGIDDLTLSEDVSGGIEQGIEDRLDHPVQVQMFNSWAADMAPADPVVDQRVGAVQHEGFERMERIGIVVADAVEEALSNLTWTDTPEIESSTWHVPINRDVIGYDADTFNYPNGGVYCSVSGPEVCTGGNHFDRLDDSCVAFPADYPAPKQTLFTSGRIADVYFTTFPGEPGTKLAEKIMDGIQAKYTDVEKIAFYGYSQDYLGYSILEEDWWNGGYEASGSLWGPKQGEYLVDQAVTTFGWTRGEEIGEQPTPLAPFDIGEFVPYTPTAGIEVGQVLTDVQEEVTFEDTLVFEVAGTDPWLGTPVATLMDANGEPVLRPNGTPVNSDGQGFTVGVQYEPSFDAEPSANARTFTWRYSFPVRHRQAIGIPDLVGSYRLEVVIPLQDGTSQPVQSRLFNVSAP